MQKLVYALWPGPQYSPDQFRDVLLSQLCGPLTQLAGVRAVRLAVADSAVAPAAPRRMECHPPVPSALLSLWVDDVSAASAWESLVSQCAQRKSGYLVVEVEPLVSQGAHPAVPGQRVHGWCQVVFFRKPQQLGRNEWLALWQGSHTSLAIDTQSTFGYRQNAVVQVLNGAAQSFDAIVEESFPPEAMTSDHAFYATGGDEALLQRRMTAMLESCGRFIDFEHIDVIPMSEYLIKPPATP